MKDKVKDIILKSILAGIVIGIGGWIYLLYPNKIVGALLFSFGLYTVVNKKYCLYTGMIGFIESKREISKLILVLIGNIIGACALGMIARACSGSIATELVTKKASADLGRVFGLSAMCGAMMYLAVSGWRQNKSPLNTIFPVMIFILCGFEHCVANAFYFGVALYVDVSFMLVNIAGNTVGALAIRLLEQISKTNE